MTGRKFLVKKRLAVQGEPGKAERLGFLLDLDGGIWYERMKTQYGSQGL